MESVERVFLCVIFQELYLENNLIEEISETVFNQSLNLNLVSLKHNRLDESRIAPLAWINHRSDKKRETSYHFPHHIHIIFNVLPYLDVPFPSMNFTI